MTDIKNPFTSEMFEEVTHDLLVNPRKYIREELKAIADVANARFREIIEACPVVYKWGQLDKATWYESTKGKSSTHKARLIVVEEI